MSTQNKNKSSDEEILQVALKRFALSEEQEMEIREQALADIRFRAGHQWEDDVARIRKQANRPSFTVNRMPQFIRQLTNDQRQNRPAIKVNPVDDKSDPEIAEVYQGLIRHIEVQSNADAAYDTAFQHAVEGGFGFVRIATEYCEESSFDQDIVIKRVPNQFSCRIDPNYQEPDGSDATWGFCYEELTKDEYEAQYGDSDLAKMDGWEGIGDRYMNWVKKDTVRVAEYFYKEFKKVKICQMPDGEVVERSELPKEFPEEMIVKERMAIKTVVHWLKINGMEVLERTIWPGKWIPIIPVLGDEIIIEGRRILEGVIRHAKDSQRLHNYFVSSEAEAIALAPKAPWIGPKGAFKGFEKKWQTANTQNHSYLEYNASTIDGKPLPPPQRNFGEPNVGAITQARMQSADDMKATTGIYDASLGARSNEQSGIAIQRRNMQAQTSNFHFVDNLTRSIKHVGRQLVDLIPKIYDTERAVRIIGEDRKEKIIVINQVVDPEKGLVKNPVNYGKYDVAVDVGPSFQTKRQEAMESMLEFMRIYPAAAPILGDLVAKNGDWPGNEEVTKRLKKMLPPELQEDEEGGSAISPQVEAQMQEMKAMIEGLTEQLNKSQDKLDNKMLELESKERIELLKLEVDLKKELLKQEAQDARVILDSQMREIDMNQKALNGKAAARQMEDRFSQQPIGQSIPGQEPTGGFSPG